MELGIMDEWKGSWPPTQGPFLRYSANVESFRLTHGRRNVTEMPYQPMASGEGVETEGSYFG